MIADGIGYARTDLVTGAFSSDNAGAALANC
jgi:hypothetical protein